MGNENSQFTETTCRNSWYSANEEDDSTHHVWSFLWSICQQIGSWCQHDLDPWVQVNSVEQQINCNSVSSWHVSHCWTSTSNHNLDYCIFVLENAQLRLTLRNVRLWGRGPHATTGQHLGSPFVWVWICFANNFLPHICFQMRGYLVFSYCSWSTILLSPTSHKWKARNPSIRSPASNEIIADSVELWDTDVCFLHIQLMESTETLPEVDFESSRSPAKSESWNKPNRQCWDVFNHMTLLAVVTRVKNVGYQSCQTSVASLRQCSDWSSKLPIRAKYKYVKTICEQTFDDSSTVSSSSFLKWWSSKD